MSGLAGVKVRKLVGAKGLLDKEREGLAIDATTEGGTVCVKDIDTLANNKNNVRINGNPLGHADNFLTQSGTSPKLCRHRDSLKWAAHNLALQSQTFDNASWTKTNTTVTANDAVAPDGTTTADKMLHTTAAGRVVTAAAISISSVHVYSASVYVKPSSHTWFDLQVTNSAGTEGCNVWFDLVNGTVGTKGETVWTVMNSVIAAVGNGWYRCSYSFLSDDTTCHIACLNTTADAVTTTETTNFTWIWGAQLNRGPVATDYVATTTAAKYTVAQEWDGSGFGMRVELAATNICKQSQNLGTTWTNTNTTESLNTTTAPDGSTTADSIIENSDLNQLHYMTQPSVSFTNGQGYTFSAYMKYNGRSAGLTFDTVRFPDDCAAYWNLQTGEVLSTGTGLVSQSITPIGNGWYRVSITAICDSTGTNSQTVLLVQDNPLDGQYDGDGTSGIYFWGAQIEAGAVATSHIPTAAANVTRARDNISVATSAMPFSATNGSVWVYARPFEVSVAAWFTNFDDGTFNEVFQVYDGGFIIIDGGLTVASLTHAERTATLKHVACAWAANDARSYKEGVAATPDTGLTLPTVTTLYLSGNVSSTSNAIIRYWAYVPRTMNDTELSNKSLGI